MLNIFMWFVLLDGLLVPPFVDVPGDDGGAKLRQLAGDQPTDARSAAGDLETVEP